MARVPGALQHFLPLYSAVIDKGSVEPKYKELAYLKTSQINGCDY
jgi:alkylhydroperoxidase family enzyme